MAWREVRSLEHCASRSLVRNLVKTAEECFKNSMMGVPPELLITRATAGLHLTNKQDEGGDRNGESWVSSTSNIQDTSDNNDNNADIMDVALCQVKVKVTAIRTWWWSLPGMTRRPGMALQQAADDLTEVDPQQDSDFIRHVTRQVLKVVLLRHVFLDRDYGDKDKRCVIPFSWEQWTAKLYTKLSPFPHIEILKVYGGLYPNILTAIMNGVLNLKELYISHINITDETLLAAQRSCPALQTFMLLHSYPWQVISLSAFCEAFFKGATKRQLIMAKKTNSNTKISLSFPNLKTIELGFGKNSVAKEFHSILLSFYKDLENVISDWKTNVLEDGYGSHSSDILLPIIKSERILSLKKLFFDASTLYLLKREQLQMLSRCCPKTKKLTIDCSARGPKLLWETAGKHLVDMSRDWKYFSSLHIAVASESCQTKDLILPLLLVKGDAISDLTIEASALGQKLKMELIQQIMKSCSSLNRLKIVVWSIDMIQNSEDTLCFPLTTHLQEICLHEEGFEDNSGDVHIQLWIKLMKALIMSAVNLHTLSVTLSQSLKPIIDHISCEASTLHLHVKDGYECHLDTKDIVKLLTKLPSIKKLYLEEVPGSTFWKLQHLYKNSSLELHWGNMYGWPRS